MNEPSDGGPAFPFDYMDIQPHTGNQIVRQQFAGMALRDYLAAHATDADVDEFIDYAEARKLDKLFGSKADNQAWGDAMRRARAEAKYRYADAMLAARKAST